MVTNGVLWPRRHGRVVAEDVLHLPLMLNFGGLNEILVVAVHGLDPPGGVPQLVAPGQVEQLPVRRVRLEEHVRGGEAVAAPQHLWGFHV